jgi:hypothetical protein
LFTAFVILNVLNLETASISINYNSLSL